MKDNTERINEINITPEMQHLLDGLKNIQIEYNTLKDKFSADFSESDKKQQDILHYIEFNRVSVVGAFRLNQELKKIRDERRRAEDNVDFIHRIGNSFSLFGNKDISNILKSKNQSMKDRKYTTRYYTEDTLNNIVKGCEH